MGSNMQFWIFRFTLTIRENREEEITSWNNKAR
jgi:hypothetical protein